MPGPAPSERKRRRNADTFADVQTRVAPSTSKVRGPTLLQATAGIIDDYDEPVRRLVAKWWDTWRRSPLTATFLATDWQRLAMLAPLVASHFARPHYTTMSEIRQSESLLGATHVDRLRARIKVEQPSAVPKAVPAGVTALNDYRSRLAN